MPPLTHIDLFAGIGGFSLACQFLRPQVITTDLVEINPFCQKVLAKHFPNAKLYSDVTTYRGDRGSHDILTAGSPCQDFSSAGKGKGINGDRSVLITDFIRLVDEIRPQGFVLENVTGIYKWLPEILTQLAQNRIYEFRWFTVSVEQLGGCHRRNRFFLLGKLAHTQSNRRTSPGNSEKQKRTDASSVCSDYGEIADSGQTKSRLCGQDDGLPSELARYLMTKSQAHVDIRQGVDQEFKSDRSHQLTALGNSLTPQQAYVALTVLLRWLKFR